jgi:ketosteroid isomerase-like protein
MTRTHAVITGKELPELVGTPLEALQEHYYAVNHRDAGVMARSWLDSSDVSCLEPLADIRRGWPAVADASRAMIGRATRVHLEFHDVTIHEVGDVFWAVGQERGWFKTGETRFDLAIRRTRIFRHVDGRWRQVHDHGSIGIPELLARYQAALAASE